MKKLLVGIFTSVLILTAGTVGVLAADSDKEAAPAAAKGWSSCSSLTAACRYTDTDHNGLCDNFEMDCGMNAAHTGEIHQGICDNRHSGTCRTDGQMQEHGHRGNHHR